MLQVGVGLELSDWLLQDLGQRVGVLEELAGGLVGASSQSCVMQAFCVTASQLSHSMQASSDASFRVGDRRSLNLALSWGSKIPSINCSFARWSCIWFLASRHASMASFLTAWSNSVRNSILHAGQELHLRVLHMLGAEVGSKGFRHIFIGGVCKGTRGRPVGHT